MAKHDIDPVLQQLVRAIDESGQAVAPVTVSVHGTVLAGDLIAQRTFFGELVAGHPLMSALEPASGLLGKEYAKETEAAVGHHLHLRVAGTTGCRPRSGHCSGSRRIPRPRSSAWRRPAGRPRPATCTSRCSATSAR